MTTLRLLSAILFFGLTSGICQEYDETIGFGITLIKAHDNKTYISCMIENHNSFPIKVSEPKCWLNTTPKLLSDGREVDVAMEIRPVTKCLNDYIEILPNDSISVNFPYVLQDLYEPTTNGELHVEFVGLVIDSKGRILKDEKKVITSNRINYP
jgi:hypothetical protein